MAIEFRCPGCQQLLRVSDESAGKKAKCPKCATILPIPASSDAPSPGTMLPPGFGTQPPEFGSQPQGFGAGQPGFGAEPQGFGATSGVGGAGAGPAGIPSNPLFGDNAAPGFGAGPNNPFGAAANPYAPPQAASYFPPVAATSGKVGNQQVEAGDIINHAFNVWKANLGILVGTFVVVLGVGMALSFVGTIAQTIMLQNRNEAGAFVASFSFSILSNLAQTFLQIGQARICLRLARGQQAEFSELFSGGSRFLPMLGGLILFGLAFTAAFVLCIAPGFILLAVCWPFYYLIVDEKSTVLESYSLAMKVTEKNRLTSVLLYFVSVGIVLLGILALCVGVLFAAPLVSMLWATAYLMMSGQLPSRSKPAAYAGQY